MVTTILIKLFIQAVLLIWFYCSGLPEAAADDIRIKYGSSSLDLRGRYIENLMVRALRISQKKYGPFSINRLDVELPSHRVLQALEEGKLINVSVAMTSSEWENKAIPIRIPVRRGIFKYRVLLVHKDNLKQFQSVTTVKQLKEMSVGLKRGWTIRTMLETLDFNIVEVDSYDMIFEMLHGKGFDYTIRGIHEAYEEIRLRRRFYDDLTVEPNILLHMPAPSYFFVSPKYPRIAERLKYGLEKMVESGELKQLFEQTFFKYIDMLDLKNRRVIEVGNPLLPENTPLDRNELWFDYNLVDN
ncbi:MAG: transporter substrate-binding domain-containing protein [Aliiglaciecola sp.]